MLHYWEGLENHSSLRVQDGKPLRYFHRDSPERKQDNGKAMHNAKAAEEEKFPEKAASTL